MAEQSNSEQMMWVEPAANQIWVDPEIRELSVRETFGVPNRGSDGGFFPDCTRS